MDPDHQLFDLRLLDFLQGDSDLLCLQFGSLLLLGQEVRRLSSYAFQNERGFLVQIGVLCIGLVLSL